VAVKRFLGTFRQFIAAANAALSPECLQDRGGFLWLAADSSGFAFVEKRAENRTQSPKVTRRHQLRNARSQGFDTRRPPQLTLHLSVTYCDGNSCLPAVAPLQ
jgi:hypothetical protein